MIAPATAVLLCAGQGSRLLPLTLTTPKCLVAVDGRAILDHQLAAVARAGIARAVVVGGYRIDQIERHLADTSSAIAVDLVFNPFWAAASSIGSVWAARAHLDDGFALMNGDTVIDPHVVADAAALAEEAVTLAVAPVATPEPDDMLVRVEARRVVAVDKALPPDLATHRSLGLVLAAAGPAYRDALTRVIARDGGIHAFHHAVIAELAGRTVVGAAEIADPACWQEIDRPDDIALWDRRHAR